MILYVLELVLANVAFKLSAFTLEMTRRMPWSLHARCATALAHAFADTMLSTKRLCSDLSGDHYSFTYLVSVVSFAPEKPHDYYTNQSPRCTDIREIIVFVVAQHAQKSF